jgi:hypothetical protein
LVRWTSYDKTPLECTHLKHRVWPLVHVSPIIVVFGNPTAAARHFAEGQFNLRLWDSDALLEKAKPFKELYQELNNVLNKDDRRIPSKESDAEERGSADDLIEKLKQGVNSPKEFELLCLSVFTFLFDPFLYGFESQIETSDGANRYDFICRIKSGNPFWDSYQSA